MTWSPGLLAPTFTPAFGAADMNALPSLSSVMSTVAFDNTTLGDQFLDLSFIGALVGSSAVVTGSGLSFLLACLQQDGTTYGDGRLPTNGTSAVYLPLASPLGGFPIVAGTITAVVGEFGYAPLRPRKFKLIVSNYSGFALAATNNQAWIATYRNA